MMHLRFTYYLNAKFISFLMYKFCFYIFFNNLFLSLHNLRRHTYDGEKILNDSTIVLSVIITLLLIFIKLI